jgi:hypothetical protein
MVCLLALIAENLEGTVSSTRRIAVDFDCGIDMLVSASVAVIHTAPID